MFSTFLTISLISVHSFIQSISSPHRPMTQGYNQKEKDSGLLLSARFYELCAIAKGKVA